MKINDYTEKEIRNKIKTKIDPIVGGHKRGKHDKGLIYVEDKVVARIKIPNNHNKIMKHSKSGYIAQSLHLSPDEFNNLIDCPLSGPQYYDLLKNKLKGSDTIET